MKLKKMLAVVSSVAMLASMAVMPMSASAAEKTIEASSGAWFRLNDKFNAWNNADSFISIEPTKATTTTTKEVQGNARFGAIYEFNIGSNLDLFTSVSLKINIASNNDTYPLGVYIYDNAVPDSDDYADLAKYYNNSDTSSYTAPTAIATQTGTGTKTITFDKDAISKLKTQAGDNNGAVRLLISSSPIRAAENKQIKIEIDGSNRPSIVVTEDVDVAKVGDTPYATFEEAVTAVADGGTIELLHDVTMESRQILEKSITINGNDHTITGPSNTFAFELKQDKGVTLNLSNVKINALGGNDAVAVKNNTLIAEKSTLSKLTAGGKYGNTIATLTDCVINDITTYGKIELNGTTTVTGTITLPNINPSGADQPKFVVGENASVTASLNITSATIPEDYTLVEGTVANFASKYNDGTYELKNGVFVKAVTPDTAVASIVINNVLTYYNDMASAIAAASNGDVITLLKDVQMDRVVMKTTEGYLSNLEIDGNEKTITSESNTTSIFEVNSGCTLTVSNTNFELNDEMENVNLSCVEVKGSGKLNATNCSLIGAGDDHFGLKVSGNYTAMNVTLTDCTVKDIRTYGKITLAGNTTMDGIIYIAGINTAAADQPEFIMQDTATVTGTLTFADGAEVAEYALVSGNVANFNATYTSDAYELVNGVIIAKPVEVTATNVGAFEGENHDSQATAFLANMGDVTGTLNVTVTSNGVARSFNGATTLTDANVVLGIIVNGLYDAVATAVVTVQ